MLTHFVIIVHSIFISSYHFRLFIKWFCFLNTFSDINLDRYTIQITVSPRTPHKFSIKIWLIAIQLAHNQMLFSTFIIQHIKSGKLMKFTPKILYGNIINLLLPCTTLLEEHTSLSDTFLIKIHCFSLIALACSQREIKLTCYFIQNAVSSL